MPLVLRMKILPPVIWFNFIWTLREVTYVVPLICSTIGNQNTRFAQQSYEHLSGLKLADSANDGE
jgi:hypothetical protein